METIVSIISRVSDIDDLVQYKDILTTLVSFVSDYGTTCKKDIKKKFKKSITRLSRAMLLDQTTC